MPGCFCPASSAAGWYCGCAAYAASRFVAHADQYGRSWIAPTPTDGRAYQHAWPTYGHAPTDPAPVSAGHASTIGHRNGDGDGDRNGHAHRNGYGYNHSHAYHYGHGNDNCYAYPNRYTRSNTNGHGNGRGLAHPISHLDTGRAAAPNRNANDGPGHAYLNA